MNKRKILTLAMALCLVSILVVGGTLAYFTDTDNADNVFTIGHVDITLNEEFDEESALLVPNIDINKDVTITLEAGSVPAYVWYTWSIPTILDSNDASQNVVHVNHSGRTWDDYREVKKYWDEDQTEALPLEQTWDIDWISSTADGVTTYTCLYHGKLNAGETTTLAMTNVYLDSRVDTYKDPETGAIVDGKYTFLGELIDFDFTQKVTIEVNAYGIQAEGLVDVDGDGDVDVYDAYYTYNNQKAAEAAN